MTQQKVTPFVFEGETTVRVIERDGLPWFVAADVCQALGVSNISQVVRQLDDDEKGVCSTYTPGGDQEMLVVSESGLFTLILRSRDAMKPGTLPHRFRHWVTGEVLPAVRRAGQAVALRPFADWRTWPEALRLRTIREIRLTHGTYAAREAWFESGLPVLPAMKRQPDLFN